MESKKEVKSQQAKAKKEAGKTLQESKQRLTSQVSKAYQKYRHHEEIWRSLEALLTLATVIILGLFAISPTVKAISDLLSEIKNKEELSGKMKTKIEQIIEAQVLFAQIQPEIGLIDQYYPIKLEMAQGLTQLLGLAQNQGLTITDLALGEIDFYQLPPSMEFSFSIQGDYLQSKKFLTFLYESRRGVVVESYQMSKDEKAQGEVINTKVEGDLLFFKKDG